VPFKLIKPKILDMSNAVLIRNEPLHSMDKNCLRPVIRLEEKKVKSRSKQSEEAMACDVVEMLATKVICNVLEVKFSEGA
jgi:hypothetical protein